MPPPSDRRRTPVEYVVSDGMRPTVAAEERGRCICFGRGRSRAVCWRSSANPIVSTCAADWSGRHGKRFSGPGLVSRETNGEASDGSAPQVSADGTEH